MSDRSPIGRRRFVAGGVDVVPEGLRGPERTRRLIRGVLASVVSRGAAAITPLLLIPVTLNYLGEEVYGLWMAVAALTSMALWADLGLGNGLLTKLGPASATGDWHTGQRLVSSAYAVLTAVALVGGAGIWLLADVVPWGALVNVTDPALVPLSRTIALICFTGFLVNIPLSLVQRVQYAYQQVPSSNFWQASGSVLSLVLALLAVTTDRQPAEVIAATVAGPLLANVANSVFTYSRSLRRLIPRPSLVDRALFLPLITLGGRFLTLSVVTSVALYSDNLIVAHVFGAAEVTQLAVPAKLFAALGLVVTLVNVPLWPANSEAMARGDTTWVRRTTRTMTLLSGAAVLIPASGLIFFGDRIIGSWSQGAVHPSQLLLVALAAWWTLLATASPRFMVQNSVGVLGPQLVGWTLFLLVSIPAKWIAAQQLGLAGVVLAGALAYAAFVWPAANRGYAKAFRISRLIQPEQEGARH